MIGSNIIPEIISQIKNGNKELHLGNVNSTRDFTFVSDTVEAFLKASQTKNAIGEIVNVGSCNEIKMSDIAKSLVKISGSNIKIKVDESRMRPYDVQRLNCNNSKAKKLLKWKPKISIEKGLELTYEWAMKNKVEFSAPFKRWYYKSPSK